MKITTAEKNNMKNYLFIVFSTLFTLSSFAQLAHTKWKATIHTPDPKNVIFDFKKDTAVIYAVAGNDVIEVMTYSATGNSLTLTKINGESDCNDGSSGQYNFSIKSDSLFVALFKDECYDRSSAIDKTKWSKWKTYPGIKVDETILRQYTGVYARDQTHPILITLENGVLYAEGPNNNLPKSPFTPISASKFFLRIAGVEMDFIKDAKEKVVTLISHEETDIELKKIK
ncbi:MAG: hypothetical protein ABIU63_09460 [Chitinophagaceae bacterium]